MHMKFSNRIKRMSKTYFHNATLKWNLSSLRFKILVGRLLKIYLHKITPLKTCGIGNRPVYRSYILCVHTMDWHVSLKICYVIHDIHHQLKKTYWLGAVKISNFLNKPLHELLDSTPANTPYYIYYDKQCF